MSYVNGVMTAFQSNRSYAVMTASPNEHGSLTTHSFGALNDDERGS